MKNSTIVLIFAMLTFLPFLFLVIGAIGHVSNGMSFGSSTLGSLVNSDK